VTLSILLIAIGYIMGSFCSAIIVCKLFDLPDPRTTGSNNPGATNVLRVAGKPYAALVLLADIFKGVIPVALAKSLGASPTVTALTVLSSVLGHVYPVFFGFKGGKGVATAIGALLGFQFLIGMMVSATWLLVANFSRYSSLASLIAIALAPFYSLLVLQQLDTFIPLFFMVFLIFYKHRNNLNRLMDGVEPKIIFKGNVIEEIMEAPEAEDLVNEPPKATEQKRATKKAPKKSSEKTTKANPASKKVSKKPSEGATKSKEKPKGAPPKSKKKKEPEQG
jgi:glycerol-3-phosphate acyltransferase PlsY